jgi:hypothetical protein
LPNPGIEMSLDAARKVRNATFSVQGITASLHLSGFRSAMIREVRTLAYVL